MRNQGDRVGARRLLGSLLAEREDAAVHRLAAVLAEDEGNYARVARHYLACCRLEPEELYHYCKRGEALLLLGRLAAASRAFYQGSRLVDSIDPDWYWHRALTHACLGQSRAQARQCETYLALAGWQADLSSYAAVYWAIAEPSRAAELAERCQPEWPRPVLECLAGRAEWAQLLRFAQTDLQRLEGTVYRAWAMNQPQDLATIAAQPLDLSFERVLARALYRPKRSPPPAGFFRQRAWLWSADQNQLDEWVLQVSEQLDSERLQLMSIALSLGAQPGPAEPLVRALEEHWNPDRAVHILCLHPRARLLASSWLPELETCTWLAHLLKVPDQEPLVLLDRQQRRGWRLKVSGVSDLFQLYALLADHLVGLPPRQAAVFAGLGPQLEPGETAERHWSLYSWEVLRPGARVRPLEGGFDQIPRLQGRPVLVLDPPAPVGTFPVCRQFQGLRAYLEDWQELDFESFLRSMS